MQHTVIHAKDTHKKRVANLSHDLLKIESPASVDAFLKAHVTSLEDARKVLAILVSAVGQLVRDK